MVASSPHPLPPPSLPPSRSSPTSTAPQVVKREIEDEMKESFLDYAMSVIVARALPDVRDGLKPVQRRVLYSMHAMGLLHSKSFKKCARIVGDCMGKYHPHGDSSIYEALVRLAQPFSLRHPLVDGQGNFGSIDGDAAAAMRYTEARLSKIAEELLNDIEKETVDFVPNYNEEMQEPVVLPSKIPNLLLNGSTGIAVGMATNIPPHNLGELSDAIVYLVDHPDCSLKDLLDIVTGPDFPTAAIVSGGTALAHAYASGRGSIVVTSRTTVEELAGRTLIVVKEIPYMLSKAQLLEELALQVKNGRVEHVSDVRDESDRDGIRIVIILAKDANPDLVRNQLFTHTRLRTTFGINMVMLVDGEPLTLGLKPTLQYFIAHRKIVVTRRAQYDLRQAQEREHKLQGLVIALDNIDAVVALIKKSRSTEEAAQGLCAAFSFSEMQAKTVLEMRLQRLTTLERTKIRDELAEVGVLITALETLLSSDTNIFAQIKKETIEIKNLYATARRTEISIGEEEELDIADLIEEGRVVVTLTQDGYVKRVPLETYRAQGRGGKGIIGAGKKEEDVVRDVFVASTHDTLLCFTNRGVVHWLKVYQIPEGQRHARGKAVVNLLSLRDGETVAALIPIHEFDQDNFIFFVTRNGLVKKTPEFFYSKPRHGGIIALGLEEGDSLVEVFVTNGHKDIILATSAGMAIRFPETDVRAMGRTAHGVYGISLREGESVIGAVASDDESQDILTVTEHGYGKRTPVSDYRKIRRSGRGVINIKQSERNGRVCALLAVRAEENVILISKQGILIQMSVGGISCIGRNTQGVRLMSLHEGDSVVAAARVVEEQELDHHHQNNQEHNEGGMTMKKVTKYDKPRAGKENNRDEKDYPDEKDLEEEDAELEKEVDSDVITAEEEGFEEGYFKDEEKSFSGTKKKEEKKSGKSVEKGGDEE